jgi:orotate phosphoribosyltransferase
MTDLLEKVLLDLESMGSIKFGEFTLKSGLKSPVYFDLRLMVSNPTLMKNIAKLLNEVPAFKISLINLILNGFFL